MGGEWKKVRLEEIATKISMGPFGSDIRTDNFVPSGIPVIRGINLSKGRLYLDEFVFVSEDKADQLSSANCFPGDIVFTHRGTLGQVGIIPNEPYKRYVVSQSQMKLTCDTSKAFPEFIYYFFKSPNGQRALLMNTSQTGVPAISRPVTSLKQIEISLPPLTEQIAIAKILNSLDKKIELHEKTNRVLEEIARAIFKHWFIDFEFPNENGEPYKSSGGEMIDSPLGPIPKGWRIGRIEDVCEVIMGQSPPGSTYNEEGNGLPFFQGNRDFGFRFPNKRIFCSGPTRQAREGDVLISVRAPVGSLNVAQETCCVGRGLAVLRPKEHYGFIFYYLKTQKHRWDAFSSEGTVFGSLRRQDLAQMEVPIPEDRLYYEFNNLVESLDTLTFINEKGINSLTELRDALLPKLMSGEIRVTDIEDKLGRGSNAEST